MLRNPLVSPEFEPGEGTMAGWQSKENAINQRGKLERRRINCNHCSYQGNMRHQIKGSGPDRR